MLVWATCIIYLHPRSQPACLAAGTERRQDPMTVHQETVTRSRGGVKVVRWQLQPGEIVRLCHLFKAVCQHAFDRIVALKAKTHLKGQMCQLHKTLLGRNPFELDSESSFGMGLTL